MSSAANVSAPRAATNPNARRLSKRVLNSLKTGASVELWVACDPYTIQVDGAEKVEDQAMLCSFPTALIRHFSKKCKREVAVNDTKRVPVPFVHEPTRLVVGWMMAGGGNELGTPELPYPKYEPQKLEILKSLATYLEIDSLVELITKDIPAATPTVPALPAPSLAANSPAKSVPVPKVCWFCNKSGHVQRHCRERNAIHVTPSLAETFAMKDAGPAVPAAEKRGSTKEKLTPTSGFIMAKDSAGWNYRLDWRKVEMEVDWPMTGGFCKVTGTADIASW